MAQKMTESVEPIELVLEFLAAKGFVNAEAALREQLELERTPLPVTEQGFSQLEAMLIRGATAGPAKSTGSILQEMRPPVLKAIVADEDMPQSPDTHAAAAAKPSAPAPAAAPVTIRWHDPDADGDVDAWTDDEALGYLQIECSEEALMRGFAASITSRDSFAAEELSAGRNPRDPIFEMYEYPTAADRGEMADDEAGDDERVDDDVDGDDDDEVEQAGAATALASASGAAATAPDPRVLCSSNGAGVKTGCAPSKAAEPAAATPAATPSTPSDAEATKARLRALHEQVMQMEAVVTAGQATRPQGDAAEVMVSLRAAAEPSTTPSMAPSTTPSASAVSASSAPGEAATPPPTTSGAPSVSVATSSPSTTPFKLVVEGGAMSGMTPASKHGPSPSTLPDPAAVLAHITALVQGAAKPTAEGVPTTAPTADVLTTAPVNGGADATSTEEAKDKEDEGGSPLMPRLDKAALKREAAKKKAAAAEARGEGKHAASDEEKDEPKAKKSRKRTRKAPSSDDEAAAGGGAAGGAGGAGADVEGPLSQEEADQIFNQVKESIEKPKPKFAGSAANNPINNPGFGPSGMPAGLTL
jgi:hypothetical protein